MLFVIVLGLAGNPITMVVLFQKEHRRRALTPLMINLAAANVLICFLGYPQSFSLSIVRQETNVFGKLLNRHLCEWNAFISTTCGFVAIISLSFMSVMTYKKSHPAEVKEEEGKILGCLCCFSLVSINLTCCSPVLRLEQIYFNGIWC